MPRRSSNPPKAAKTASTPSFAVGETIVRSGIYRVAHTGHRVSHYVILLSGDSFPRCARCGDQVRFELFQATTDLKSDPDFRVRLYEIPHPPPADGEEETEDEVA
jgi:hypothetical protein